MMPTVNLCSDCEFATAWTPVTAEVKFSTRFRMGPCGRYPGLSRTEARAQCNGALWARQTPPIDRISR